MTLKRMLRVAVRCALDDEPIPVDIMIKLSEAGIDIHNLDRYIRN